MSLASKLHNRQAAFEKAEKTINSSFIAEGYPSIKIISEDGNTSIQAAVVNRQESDEAYILTPYNKPLEIGSVWSAKGLSWLVAEEIVIIKNVNWRKYYCYLCNAELKGHKVFFYGTKKTRINVNLKQNTFLLSSNSPVLVCGSSWAVDDKFIIKGRAWRVVEYDNISESGICYYTLKETTISKGNNIELVKKNNIFDNIDGAEDANLKETGDLEPDTPIYIRPGVAFVLEGVNYTVSSSRDVQLVSRTARTFTFKLNAGVSSVTITVDGNKQYTYTSIKRKELA